MWLTPEKALKYLKASHACPNCGSENIEGGFVEISEGGATQDVHCNDCNKRWFDIYQLVDVDQYPDESEGESNGHETVSNRGVCGLREVESNG